MIAIVECLEMSQTHFSFWRLFVSVILLLSLCCCTHGTERVLGSRSDVANKFIVTPRCMGAICLGENLMGLKEKEGVKLRVDEFRYTSSSIIDSVLFSEWVVDGEVVAYTRNSIFNMNDSTSIKMVVSESGKMMFPNGVRVGMRFNELKDRIPDATFSRRPHEDLGSGQYRQRVALDDVTSSLVVINYQEQRKNDELDTLITSILLNIMK